MEGVDSDWEIELVMPMRKYTGGAEEDTVNVGSALMHRAYGICVF